MEETNTFKLKQKYNKLLEKKENIEDYEEWSKNLHKNYNKAFLIILGISTIIIPVLSLIFIIFRIINSKYIISDLVSITLAQLSVSLIYQYIKTQKLSVLIIGLITLILTIIFTICFIKEVVI